jgi:secreted PhoX family phosphatase
VPVIERDFKVAKHINELIASRRALLGGLAGLPLLDLAACATPAAQSIPGTAASGAFDSVAATNADTVTLPPGYSWRKLIAWGDALFEGMPDTVDLNTLTRAEQDRRFGQNNDMLALFAADYAFPPPKTQDRMILCANNEYASVELAYPSLASPRDLTAGQVEALLSAVGVSVVDIERHRGGWRVVKSSASRGNNRRITPFTPVVFSGPAANHPWIRAAAEIVNGAEPAAPGSNAPANAVRCGTLANCAGGLTPWGTYLTSEENFNYIYFGSLSTEAQIADPALALDASSFGYPVGGPTGIAPRQFQIAENPRGPSLYGWVVEIDPYDPTSTPKKRTALGRKKGECATTALTRDGRVAVYMGDDERNEHVYKFVTHRRFDPANRAANMDLLDDGQLYVAQFTETGGLWIPITVDAANAAAIAQGSPVRFSDEADVLVRVRMAAFLLGATPMDRPEDIEALHDQNWRGLGPVLIACTNNSDRGFAHPGNPRRDDPEHPNAAQSNHTGHILRIDENGGDCGATTFTWDIFAMGGDPNAESPTVRSNYGRGAPTFVDTSFGGHQTISGARFACPDNLFIDSTYRVWIATDGSDTVFSDCNDCVMMTPSAAERPRPMKRFLVGPLGAEICGPLMAPDERAFFCAIQHPGGNDASGADYSRERWIGAPVPSHFPDGGNAWPRSAVVVITKDDGGRIGD